MTAIAPSNLSVVHSSTRSASPFIYERRNNVNPGEEGTETSQTDAQNILAVRTTSVDAMESQTREIDAAER